MRDVPTLTLDEGASLLIVEARYWHYVGETHDLIMYASSLTPQSAPYLSTSAILDLPGKVESDLGFM